MPNLTINTNVSPAPTFYYRWRNLAGGVFTSWATTAVSPFNVVTPDLIHTNYEFQIYNYCSAVSQSAVSSFTTTFIPTCNIVSLSNVVVGLCNSLDNTHTLTFDVVYSGMKDNAGTITSVFDISIGTQVWYVNPAAQSGTQTIQISGIAADGLSKTLQVVCLAS